MKNGYYIWIFLFLLISVNSNAQIWLNGFDKFDTTSNKRYNFYEIQNDFNKYWEGKNINRQTPKNERGGWMQFKRWEWFWQERVFPTGKFPDPMHTYNELKKLQNRKEKDVEVQQSSNWQSLGPVSSTGGYAGLGRLNCIEEDPDYNGTSNKTIWVGSASGGLWKSTDDGETWTSNTDKLPSLGISSICINPNNKNIMYIATGDGDANDTYSVGVLKSTDGGANWSSTGLDWTVQQNRVVRKIVMHPTDYNILYAATSVGVYKTTDAGTNWTLLSIAYSSTSGGIWDIEFKPGSPNVMYASSTWEIARTTNGGDNWTILSGALPDYGDNTYRVEIAVTPNDANYIYAVYGYRNYGGGNSANNSGLYGIYRSSNSGTDWTEMLNWDNSNLNLLGWQANGSDAGGQAWYDLAIAASPTNKNYVFVGGVNVWRTTNGGVDWGCVAHWWGQNNVPAVHADHHHLHFAGNSERLYAGHDGGINRTTNNGTSWSWLGTGLKITQLYRLGVSQTNSTVTIAGSQDNGTKLKSGSDWYDVIGGDGMECIIDYTNSDIMWGSVYYGQIERSTNGGSSWSGISKPNENGAWVTPYVLHPTNPQTMYSGFKNVWISTNRGTSWSAISNFSSGTLTLLHVAPSNPNYIYTGFGTTLRKTTNGGTNWSNVTLPTGNSITYMAIHPDNPNRIWATFSGYSSGQKVYYSTNGGTNWTNVSGDLPNIPVNTIVFQKNMDNRVYVGTDLGVFYMDDNTSGWVQFNNGLPNVIVSELEIQEEDNLLFAATYGRGVWNVALPGEYVALTAPTQNYPANAATNIRIDTLLNWSTVQTADSYQIQVSLNADFSTTISNVTQSGLNFSMSNFSPQYSITYHWRVRAKRDDEYGPWSTRSFTTQPIPLVAPVLTNPADIAVNVSLNTNLTWNSVQGADNYQIQISLSSNFSTTLVNLIQNVLTYSLSNINPDYSTTYYWRVRAKRGDEEGPLATRSFTTEPIPLVAPVLTNPADLATNVQINSNLTWNSVQGADNYQIQISLNSDFSTFIANVTQTGLNFAMSNFSPQYSTTYYWRVRAKRGDEEGPLSTRSFTTEPIPLVAPVLTNPTNNASSVSLNSNLTWNSVQGAENYQVQISLNSNFSDFVIDLTQNGLTYSISNLNYSTTYHWRIRAKRGNDLGPWATRSFTTEPIPLVAPVLTSPADNATNVTLNADLDWESVEGADSYQVQVSLTSTFIFNIKDVSQSDISYSLNNVNLNYSTKYYWRIRAKRNLETGPWASNRNFTTQPIPLVAPNLSSPADNATNIVITSNLSWGSVTGANGYQLQASLNSDFSDNIIDISQSNLSYSLSNADIEFSTKYFWRVRAKRNDELGPWANYRNFTTQPIPLVAPQLNEPAHLATNIAIDSDLSWFEVEGADSYQLQISSTSNFFSIITDENIIDLGYSLSNSNLSYSTNYYWRVRSKRNDDVSAWSSSRRFTTQPIPLVAPVLTNPNDNATNIAINSNLDWGSVTDANNYNLQISLNSNFTNNLVDLTYNGLTYSLSNANLDYSTNYYWRVRAKRNDEEGPWAIYRIFTTEPIPLVAPVLVAPADNAIKIAINSNLSWNQVQGADSYNLQIALNSNFTNLIKDVTTNVLSFSLLNADIDYSTKYFWRVRATRGEENGPWATERNFTTRNEFLPPQQLYPPDLAENILNSEKISWAVVEDAENYHLQVSHNSNFSDILFEDDELAVNEFAISSLNLSSNQVVFWRIKSINSLEQSSWSSVRKFTSYPKTNFCDAKAISFDTYISNVKFADLNYNSTVNWGYSNFYNTQIADVHKKSPYQFTATASNSTASTNFKLWIDWNNDGDFDDVGEAISGSTGIGPYSVNITIPSNAVTNSVHARMILSTEAINSYCGIINNGEVEDFAMNILPALVVPPELIIPANNATGIELQAELIWDEIENATGYNLQISEYQNFNSILYQTNTNSTSHQIPENILTYRKSFYWRVNSTGNYNTSDYSAIRKFSTKLSVPDSWTFTSNTGLSSMIRVPHTINPKIGNRTILNGDAIGLFFDNNGLEFCAGFGVWNGTTLDITVWGDDPITVNKDGYDDGEEYSFKLWDSQLDLVYPAIANYQSGPDEFTNNALSVLSLLESTVKFHQINLSSGWNMISSYIRPIQPDMATIWENIKDDVTIVKNGLGNNYIPQFDINSIGNWNLFDGYQVYMNNPATLTIGGIEATPQDEEIELPFGWSLISYIRNTSMNIETALETLTNSDALVLAKDNDGNSYIPMFDINGIGNMVPGKGYQVYLLNPKTLIYPMNNQPKSAFIDTKITPTLGEILIPEIRNTGDNMTLIVELDKPDNGLDIGVYNNENILVGSGRIIENKAFITVWNDSDNDVKGNKKLIIKTYDKISGQFFNMNIISVKNFLNGIETKDLTYKTDAVIYINAGIEYDINSASISASPNPFSERCEVAVYMPEQAEFTLKMYTSGGAEVYSESRVNSSAGRHFFVIESGVLAAGDYTLILHYDNKTITKKIILMK